MRRRPQPVRVGEEFWSFFHGVQHGTPRGNEYTLGLYTFDARPPFAPNRMIPLPLLRDLQTSRPRGENPAIFPCGAVWRGETWLVSYGRNNSGCEIAVFDHAQLEAAMVHLKQPKLPSIYCITCRQLDRRATAEEHFKSRGLDVKFVDGVHGDSWRLSTEAPIHDEMTPGHIGNCLSHWMLWRLIEAGGDEEALILEDDATFAEDFKELFFKLRARLPADWQFCFVGSLGLDDEPRASTREFVSNGLCRVPNPRGMHCYLVRRSALPVLIETMQQARKPVDQQLSDDAASEAELVGRLPVAGIAADLGR